MPSLRRALVTGSLVSAAIWAAVVILWTDAPFALTFDDAWYYAGIARNLAGGRGSTFDGLNPTNGYHPLWLGACAAVFATGLDGVAAVRALLAVQVLAWAAALVLVATTIAWVAGPLGRVNRAVVAVVWFLVTASPFVVKTFVNGLETGIAVTVHAAVLAVGARHPDPGATSRRTATGLGLLLALAFLARTDAAALTALVALWMAPGAWRRRSLASPALVVGPPAVVAAGYLALNHAAFGSPWQVSGIVKRAPVTVSSVLSFVVVVLLVLGVAARLTGDRAVRFPRAGRFAAATAWYGAAAGVSAAYYQFLQTQQWLWYYAPLLLWLAVVFVLAVADVIAVAGSDRRALAVGGLVFVLPLAVGGVVQVAGFADPGVRSIQLADRRAGEWIDAHLPAGAVLASWDAGVVGYFAHRSVVNLDGVVNSHAWADALAGGTAGAVLRCQRVAWVVNHGPGAGGDDAEIVGLIGRVWGGPTTVVRRVPYRYRGTTNAGGLEVGEGLRDQEVRVYRIDPARVGPGAGDQC